MSFGRRWLIFPATRSRFFFGSLEAMPVRQRRRLFVLNDEVAEEELTHRTLDAGVALGWEVNVVTMRADELASRAQVGSGLPDRFARAAAMGDQRLRVAG
jgi:hypothetical protein